MKYRLKWIEENLGITRSAIRYYEGKGLLPTNTYNQRREYSEEEVEGLWAIQILQGMGYSIDEIITMRDNPEFDFQESIGGKIKELEMVVQEKVKHINYAKTIKLFGRFPSRPKEMGSITADEFCEKALNEWNIQEDDTMMRYQELADLVLKSTDAELADSELGKLFGILNEMDIQSLVSEETCTVEMLLRQLVKRKDLGHQHPEVQLLVKMIYEEWGHIVEEEVGKITPQQFARYYGTSFMAGDVRKINETKYGEQGCDFIAEAIACFGGYTDKEDMM